MAERKIPTHGEGTGKVRRSGFSLAPWLAFALCLSLGVGAGYVERVAHAKQANEKADAAGALHGQGNVPRGPCKVWAETICERMGEPTYECKTAVQASYLLSGSACQKAIEGVSSKIDELETARVSCEDLAMELCEDLGAKSAGCEYVKAQSRTLKPSACDRMKGSDYQKTLAQVMAREKAGTLPRISSEQNRVAITKPK